MYLIQQKTFVLVPHITISTARQAEPAAQIAALRLSALMKVSMMGISRFESGAESG